MKCANHPLKDATASCSNCGRFICEQCAQELNGKNVCPHCSSEASQITLNSHYQPVSGGVKFLLYLVSFFAMPLGLLIGVIFYTQPDINYNRVGRNCIVIALVPFILFCVCFLSYFFFAFGGAIGSGILDKAMHLPVY